MTDMFELLVPILAGAGTASALVSSVLSIMRRGSRPTQPRVLVQIEQADGTHTTAVLTGVDDHQTEEIIRDIEQHAVKHV